MLGEQNLGSAKIRFYTNCKEILVVKCTSHYCVVDLSRWGPPIVDLWRSGPLEFMLDVVDLPTLCWVLWTYFTYSVKMSVSDSWCRCNLRQSRCKISGKHLHRPTNAWVQDLMCIQYKAPNLQYVGARFDKLPEYDIQICNARGAGHEICNAWVPDLMSI